MQLTHHVRHPVDGWLTDPVEEESGRYHHGEYFCDIGLELFWEITPEEHAAERAKQVVTRPASAPDSL